MHEQGIDMDNRIYIDEETGEDMIHPFVDCNIRHSIDSMAINDAETGEPEVNHIDNTVRGHRRVPFQVLEKIFASVYPLFKFIFKFSDLKFDPIFLVLLYF